MSLIITVMVINMQEERLDSIEGLEQFLTGTAVVSPLVTGGEADRQACVQRVSGSFSICAAWHGGTKAWWCAVWSG